MVRESQPGYQQAAQCIAEQIARLHSAKRARERVPLDEAVNRILATPLCADRDQPPFARSTRDGYACIAKEATSGKTLIVAGSTHAGEAPSGPLLPGTAWEIMTGAPVPAGADAVLMLEHVALHKKQVQLLSDRKIKAGENIVAQGSQGRTGDLLLRAGTRITAAQIALAAACGYATLQVFQRPRVAVLTTGDELVPVDAKPAPGQIRNSNAPMLAAMIAAAGAEPWLLPAAADNPKSLDAALKKAMRADLLVLSGGVSAGKFDLVEPALARAGAKFHFTATRIQPGKPTVFGQFASKSKSRTIPMYFFGLPGNPISSAVTFLLFVKPLLMALAGSATTGPEFAYARMAKGAKRSNKPGLTRFLPAYCTWNATQPEVSLVPWQGSGDLTALARSNCFLVVEEDTGLPNPGSIVRVLLS